MNMAGVGSWGSPVEGRTTRLAGSPTTSPSGPVVDETVPGDARAGTVAADACESGRMDVHGPTLATPGPTAPTRSSVLFHTESVASATRAALLAVSGAIPAMSLVAASALPPGPVAGPSAWGTHESNVALLERLKSAGVSLWKRALIPQVGARYRPTSPEEVARYLEKEHSPLAPEELGRAPLMVGVRGGYIGGPLQTLEDLADLAAAELGEAAPGARDLALARALHAIAAEKDDNLRLDIPGSAYHLDKDYDGLSRECPISPYMAFRALTDGLPGTSGPVTSRWSRDVLKDRSAVMTKAYFVGGGPLPPNLEDVPLAVALRNTAEAVTLPVDTRNSHELFGVYQALLQKPPQDRELQISYGEFCVSAFAPGTYPDREQMEAVKAYSEALRYRIGGWSSDESLLQGIFVDKLLFPRAVGQVDDRAQAVATLATLGRGSDGKDDNWRGLILEDVRAVSDTLVDGASAADAATRFATLYERFDQSHHLAREAFRGLEEDLPRLQSTLGPDVAAERYVTLMEHYGTRSLVEQAWTGVVAGSTDTCTPERRWGLCLELEKHDRADGPRLWKSVLSAAQVQASGDGMDHLADVEKSLATLMGRLLDATAGDVEESEKAFAHCTTTLRGRSPQDVDHFVELLTAWKKADPACRSWDVAWREASPAEAGKIHRTHVRLATATSGNEAEFDVVLQRLSSADERSREETTLLMEATGSTAGAEAAERQLDAVPWPCDRFERVRLFASLASLSGRDTSRALEHLRFLTRYAGDAARMDDLHPRYVRLLAAAAGDPGEARKALALADLHLGSEGPSQWRRATREMVLARALQGTRKADEAWKILCKVEQADIREEDVACVLASVDGLERSLQAAVVSEPARTAVSWLARTAEDTPSTAAMEDPSEKRGVQLARLVDDLAKLAPTVRRCQQERSMHPQADRWIEEHLLAPSSPPGTLRTRVDCLQRLLARPEHEVRDFYLWPPLMDAARQFGWEEARAVIDLASGDEPVSDSLLQEVVARPALVRAYGSLIDALHATAEFSRVGSSFAARTQEALVTWASSSALVAPASQRVARWTQAIGQLGVVRGVEAAWRLMEIPVGRESLVDREDLMLGLATSLGQENVDDLWALMAEAYPKAAEETFGDLLVNGAAADLAGRVESLAKEWASAWRGIQGETHSRSVTREAWMQLRNWSREPGMPALPSLVGLFATAWEHATDQQNLKESASTVFGSGKKSTEVSPLDVALSEVRKQAAPPVRAAAGELVLGGVRIPRRQPNAED